MSHNSVCSCRPTVMKFRSHLTLSRLIACLLLFASLIDSAAINRTVHIDGPKGDEGIIQLPFAPLQGFSDRDHVGGVRKGGPLGPPVNLDSKNLLFDHNVKGQEVKGGIRHAEQFHQKEKGVPIPGIQMPGIGAAHGLGNAGIMAAKAVDDGKPPVINANVVHPGQFPVKFGNPLPHQVKEQERSLDVAQNAQGPGNRHIVPQQHEQPKPLPPHIVPMKLDEVQPPDHVDGLRVEHDGHLNRDYKKEILIGNHDEFERNGEKRLLSRLKIVFIKADTDHDSFLTHAELKTWIMFKVQEHLDEALAENERIFHHLDTDGNGNVTWKEFHVHFLLAKGHDQNDTLKHVDDYESLTMDSEERERLIRYKFRWAEADEDPQDNQLTIHEMQNFRHPEQSSRMIVRMAKDIIDNLDHNEDGIITEEEFVALPPGDSDDMMHERRADEMWQNERLKEFRGVIDLNHDGKVDIEELKIYVDPHNENHAHLEADNLIQLADENNDGKLSMSEVLDNAELFLGSKMVDTGRNFHDEF